MTVNVEIKAFAPLFPLLLRYRDGLDIDLMIALREADLRGHMEWPDVEEGAWDGYDSNHTHFKIRNDKPGGKFLLDATGYSQQNSIEESIENYRQVYEIFSNRQKQYALVPDELLANWTQSRPEGPRPPS